MNSGHFCRLLGPQEFPAVYDGPANMHAVAADELRGRVHDDVKAVFDRAEQSRRQRGVVDDRRQAMTMRHAGDRLVVGHVVLRIAGGFDEHGAGVLVHQLADIFGPLGIEEPDLDTEFLKGLGKQRPGPTVQAVGRDEVLSRVRDGQQRRRDGCLAAGQCQRRRTAIEGCQPLFEDVGGGIHQSRVDVPEFAQAEQVGCVFGVVKHVARCGVDRHGPRCGRGVGGLTGVKCKRAKTWTRNCRLRRFAAHVSLSLSVGCEARGTPSS